MIFVDCSGSLLMLRSLGNLRLVSNFRIRFLGSLFSLLLLLFRLLLLKVSKNEVLLSIVKFDQTHPRQSSYVESKSSPNFSDCWSNYLKYLFIQSIFEADNQRRGCQIPFFSISISIITTLSFDNLIFHFRAHSM